MVNASPYLTGTSVSVPLATPATTARLIMVRMKYECVITSFSQIMKCSSGFRGKKDKLNSIHQNVVERPTTS